MSVILPWKYRAVRGLASRPEFGLEGSVGI